MLSGRTYQREGATYSKARWPYADLQRREGMCLRRRSEIEGNIFLNRPVCGGNNFVVDTFLNEKPVKLSKNRSDMISFYISLQFLQQHFALPETFNLLLGQSR